MADIDLMIPAFLRIRARPDEQEDIRWEFENVTFLLNTIDVLASDTDYIAIRKRKPRYTTLKVVESRVEEARDRRIRQARGIPGQVRQGGAGSGSGERTGDAGVPDRSWTICRSRRAEGKEINQAELREKAQRLEEQQRGPRTPPGDPETAVRA